MSPAQGRQIGRGGLPGRSTIVRILVRLDMIEVAGSGRACAPREDADVVAEAYFFGHSRWWVVSINRPAVFACDVQDGLDGYAGSADPFLEQVEGEWTEAFGGAGVAVGEAEEIVEGGVQVELGLARPPVEGCFVDLGRALDSAAK